MECKSMRDRYKMPKNRFFLAFLFLCLCYQTHAQSYESQGFFKISATRFSLPENNSGLTDPAFIIWGKFTKTSIGDKYYLYLRVRFEHSTANNPNPSFWYSYKNHNGKIYTDKEIGTAPFQSIRFLGASFDFKVSYGIHTVNITMNHDDYKRMGEVPKDFDINNASVFVGDLVWYNHEATAVKNAIATYENAIKKKEEEAQKAKEAEEREKKAAAKKAEEEEKAKKRQTEKNESPETNEGVASNSSGSSSTKSSESNNDFWETSHTSPKQKDPNIKSASQFGGNLTDVQEGGYFKDTQGNYYIKENGNARKVSQSEYENDYAQRTLADWKRQEEEANRKIENLHHAVNTSTEVLMTSFYIKERGSQMRDATQLKDHYDSVEELNESFYQQLNEINAIGQEIKSASVENMNRYTTAVTAGATTSGDYTRATALSVFGAVAASISADNSAQKAREELYRQRAEAEAEIRERYRAMVVSMRNEIMEIYAEGGMPLSSHKIDVPVLYLFAYSVSKTNWEKDEDIPITVSNVIPVYRYHDGTYPYTSQVRKTFENGGIKDPTVIGYFTHKKQAEEFRSSLINIAPGAKMDLHEVSIKVKEKDSTTQETNSQVDFWGNKNKESNPKKNPAETELDFWGMPVKKKETNKNEQKKQDDFWNN